MKNLLIIILSLVLTGCSSTSPIKQQKTAVLLEELNDPSSSYVFVAAHRGGHERDWENRAPENSISNIQKAIKMDFAIYESDLRVTKDGHFVIMHDPTIDRTTNGKGLVSDLELSEIKRLKLKYKNKRLSPESVPTLEEFLINGKNKILFKIDFKAPIEFLPKAVSLVKKHDMLGHVFFRFDWSNEVAKEIANCISRGMAVHPKLILFRTTNSDQIQAALTRFKPEIIELHLKDKIITPDAIKAIKLTKEKGVLIGITSWGGEKEWEQLINHGFRMFHTKKPEEFTKFLNKL